MPHTEALVRRHRQRVRPPGFVLKTAATAISALKTWQRTASSRRAIADLPPERLRDIGHAEPPVPVLEVKAGLVATLMSMR